jgi:hypothetical protein
MLVAQRPIGVQHHLGADQRSCFALELEHVEQVPVVTDVAAEPTGGGEREVSDPVPGGYLHQLGGMRTNLLLGRGRQAVTRRDLAGSVGLDGECAERPAAAVGNAALA